MISNDTIAILVVLMGLFTVGMCVGTMLLISRDTNKISEILSRVWSIETNVSELTSAVRSDISSAPTTWQSADGKYQASSFEELIAKMAADPNSGLAQEDIDAINRIFGQISHDDSEDDGDSWKKNK